MSSFIDPFKSQQIRVAVDAVCIATEGDEKYILLIKREYEPFKGTWAIPGGFLDEDEELADGAVRELREESNLTSEIDMNSVRQIGAYGAIDRDPRPRRVISVAFLVPVNERSEVSTANESLDVQWLNLNQVDEIEFAFDHRQIVADALELL